MAIILVLIILGLLWYIYQQSDFSVSELGDIRKSALREGKAHLQNCLEQLEGTPGCDHFDSEIVPPKCREELIVRLLDIMEEQIEARGGDIQKGDFDLAAFKNHIEGLASQMATRINKDGKLTYPDSLKMAIKMQGYDPNDPPDNPFEDILTKYFPEKDG